MKSKTNIVLVHGAWADGSSWGKVIPFLQQKGFNVTAAQDILPSEHQLHSCTSSWVSH
jgi:hypothetical protein